MSGITRRGVNQSRTNPAFRQRLGTGLSSVGCSAIVPPPGYGDQAMRSAISCSLVSDANKNIVWREWMAPIAGG